MATGLRVRAKLNDLVDLRHVSPTMAAPKIAAISRYKDPAKRSCFRK